MSFLGIADAVVRGIPFEAFDVIVTGEDVEHGKPEPEAYLRAADLLGVDIAGCGRRRRRWRNGRRSALLRPPSRRGAYTMWDTLAGQRPFHACSSGHTAIHQYRRLTPVPQNSVSSSPRVRLTTLDRVSLVTVSRAMALT
jgi:hypothetical protein